MKFREMGLFTESSQPEKKREEIITVRFTPEIKTVPYQSHTCITVPLPDLSCRVCKLKDVIAPIATMPGESGGVFAGIQSVRRFEL